MERLTNQIALKNGAMVPDSQLIPFSISNATLPTAKQGAPFSFEKVMEKLRLLTTGAKYDVSCVSSGVGRKNKGEKLGNAADFGICHSWSADGRCVSLLKVLMSNDCIYNCLYCVNKASADLNRVSFEPDELARIVVEFYKRNYIEGLFLSSAVQVSPDYTSEKMFKAIKLLRETYNFNGYIHAKIIPGTNPSLISKIGFLVDRVSVNVELPSEKSLKILAPQKAAVSIFKPMSHISDMVKETALPYKFQKNMPAFAKGGQSTQMIIGASKETDLDIIKISSNLYSKFDLKRVFYSAYLPVNKDQLLPSLLAPPPLLREHRLYQSDWLMRFYHFKAEEILDATHPFLDLDMDPKTAWAMRHFKDFPMDINKVSYEELLRIPGIGVLSAQKILRQRRISKVQFEDLKRMGVVMKRAIHFITCSGHHYSPFRDYESVLNLFKPKETTTQLHFFQ